MSIVDSTECSCFLCIALVGVSSSPADAYVPASLRGAAAAPEHILLVDDDPATLLALAGVLETRFHNIVIDTCESGVLALQKIATCDYDAIVSDVKMPGMDGLELMGQVLKIRPTTPTLLISGHGDPALGVKALNGGAYTFIQKPIDRDYFTAWLKRAFHLRQAIRQAEVNKILCDPLES